MRAIRKSEGPDRISQCSYGVLVEEPHEPEKYLAHKHVRARLDVDGNCWVRVIDWLIHAVGFMIILEMRY